MPLCHTPARDGVGSSRSSVKSSALAAESLERRALVAAGVVDRGIAEGGIATIPVPGENDAPTGVAVMPDGRFVVNDSPDADLLIFARFRADGTPEPIFGQKGVAATDLGDDAEVRAVEIDEQQRQSAWR